MLLSTATVLDIWQPDTCKRRRQGMRRKPPSQVTYRETKEWRSHQKLEVPKRFLAPVGRTAVVRPERKPDASLFALTG